MKISKANLLLFIIFLSLSLIVGCSKMEGPLANDKTPVPEGGSLLKGSGPSASGQGKISGTDRVFAFNATTRPNGTVKGEGTLNRTSSGTKFKFSINCLSVDGNVATMSGTVTESNAFPNSVGLPCWFRVEDNGEGTNAPPDEMTFWYFCDGPEECDVPACDEFNQEYENEPLYPIEAGNIQVRP